MASAYPVGDADLRHRWQRYKAVMEENASEAVKFMSSPGLLALKTHLLQAFHMHFEFSFIHIDCDEPLHEIVARLWNVLVFRPDVASAVEQLCRGEDINQERFANLLKWAIEVAGWNEEFWYPSSQADASSADLRRTGDALAGLATTCCGDLQRRGILTKEGASAVASKAAFSDARGSELIRQLTLQGWSDLRDFCEKEAKNRFLVTTFDCAAEGHWPGPLAIASTVPDLPSYVTVRDCFRESREKLREAMANSEQEWVGFWGPRTAGKTTAAIHLANHVPDGQTVLWIRFGEESNKNVIYHSAQEIVQTCFPSTDLGKYPNAETYLRNVLTKESTKGFIFFLDDVCDANLLSPFAEVKTAVVTSHIEIDYYKLKSIRGVQVGLSLTERESLDIIENVLDVKLSAIDGGTQLREILVKIHFNALATSVLAFHIKSLDKRQRSEGAFRKLKNDMERNANKRFKVMSIQLKKTTGHPYAAEEEKRQLNAYAMIELIIQGLSEELEELKEAFYSLIVFPRDTPIVSHVFVKINDCEDYLKILCERSLLMRIGDNFSMHGFIREILEDNVSREQKKKYFQLLVDSYESDKEIDANDTFYYLYYIRVCLNAERTDVAQRLLSSAEYLLSRFFKMRFTNLFADFEALLSEEPNDVVKSFQNFFLEPNLWNQNYDKVDLLRQATVLRRGEFVGNELQCLLLKETELPLFEVTSLEIEELQCSYREVTRLEYDRDNIRIKRLTSRDNGCALAIFDVLRSDDSSNERSDDSSDERSDDSSDESSDESSAPRSGHGCVAVTLELLLYDPLLSVRERRSFDEEVLCVTPASEDRWLLVTQNACVLIGSDLSEVARCPTDGRVTEAAVDLSGDFAALLVEGHRLILFRTAEESMEEICAVEENWEVFSLAVTSGVVAVLYESKKKKEEKFSDIWMVNPFLRTTQANDWTSWFESGKKEKEKKCQKILRNIYIWNTNVGEEMQHELQGQLRELGFLSHDRMILCGGGKISTFDWRSGEELSSDDADWKHFKSSPDGSCVAAFLSIKSTSNLDFLQVFDCNLTPLFHVLSETVDFSVERLARSNLGFNVDNFVLSKSGFIVSCKKDTGLALFHTNEHTVHVPRVRSSKHHIILGAVSLAGQQDFGILVRDCDQYFFKSQTDGSEICRADCSGWKEVEWRVDENGAAVFEFGGHRLVLLWPREQRQENNTLEEEIFGVGWKDPSFVAILTSKGQLLSRRGSQWHEMFSVDADISKQFEMVSRQSFKFRNYGVRMHFSQGIDDWVDLFVFEKAVGVLLQKFSFRIFSLEGQQLFSAERIGSVHLSPCRKRAELVVQENLAVEVSQEGRELQRTQHSHSCSGARCIPNGLVSWGDSWNDEVIVKEKRKEERKLKNPKSDSIQKVYVANDVSFALFLGKKRILIQDLRTGKAELLFDKTVAGIFIDDLSTFYISSCEQSVLVTLKDNNSSFVLQRKPLLVGASQEETQEQEAEEEEDEEEEAGEQDVEEEAEEAGEEEDEKEEQEEEVEVDWEDEEVNE